MFNFECWILNDEWGMEEGEREEGGGGGRRPGCLMLNAK
jgi:hypothetical protein